MRIFRLCLALAFVAFALWAIVGEHMTGASANATVNARVVDLRTPIAGDITMPNRALGTRVSTGEELARVADPLADATRLNDLYMEEAKDRASLEAVQAQLAKLAERSLHERDTGLPARALRTAQLRIEAEGAAERLRILEAQAGQEGQDGADAPEEDDPQENDAQASDASNVDISRARQEARAAQTALEAAMEGTAFGPSYAAGDQAALATQANARGLVALRAEAARLRGHLDATATRIQEAQRMVNRLSAQAITSPTEGILWDILQAHGVNVQRGDPVLRVADCTNVIVTASVSQRVYNRLSVGQSAEVRLDGEGRIYRASIARLAGSGASGIYPHMAIFPSARHLERYDVALLVPDLNAPTHAGCLLGRTARVFFEPRPMDWLRDWWKG